MTAAGDAGGNAPARRLGRRALDGILWTFSSAAAKGVIQILVLMVLARLLDPNAFGVVAAGLLVVRLAASLSTAGVGAANARTATAARAGREMTRRGDIRSGVPAPPRRARD